MGVAAPWSSVQADDRRRYNVIFFISFYCESGGVMFGIIIYRLCVYVSVMEERSVSVCVEGRRIGSVCVCV